MDHEETAVTPRPKRGFIKTLARALGIRIRGPNVSPDNILVSSYIPGIDDLRNGVSPRNILVNADIGLLRTDPDTPRRIPGSIQRMRGEERFERNLSKVWAGGTVALALTGAFCFWAASSEKNNTAKTEEVVGICVAGAVGCETLRMARLAHARSLQYRETLHKFDL